MTRTLAVSLSMLLSSVAIGQAAVCKTVKGEVTFFYGDCTQDAKGKRTFAAAADRLIGTDGRDVITGGKKNDTLFGNDDDDTIDGGTGDDKLFGGDGSDDLSGGEGNDTLTAGGPGDLAIPGGGVLGDFLRPGNGVDKVFGSSGADHFYLDASKPVGSNTGAAGDDRDTVDDGLKADTIRLEGGNDVVHDINKGLPDNWNGGPGFDTMDYSKSATALDIDLSGGKTKGPSNDTVVGFESFVLSSKSDDMTIDYDVSDTSLAIEGFDYRLLITGSSSATKTGDTIVVKDGRKTLTGAGAAVYGSDGIDAFATGSLDDLLFLGKGDDFGHGGAGDDRISGNEGDDHLWGEDGDDFLFGGIGKDTLNGGKGGDAIDCGLKGATDEVDPIGDGVQDTIVYESTADSPIADGDRIVSFEPKIDKIDLSAVDADSKKAGKQPFTLVRALTGKPGQLMVSLTQLPEGLSSYTLFGDTDGNFAPDFMAVTVNVPDAYKNLPVGAFLILTK